MTTTSNEPINPLGACGADTNPSRLYEVTVHRVDYLYARIRVDATTESEAEIKAKEIAELQAESAWKFADRDVSLADVEQITEGGSNE
jgi:hypothetical protein